jgi:hypothetical protein
VTTDTPATCALCWRKVYARYRGPCKWFRGTALCQKHFNQAMNLPDPATEESEAEA